MLRRVIVTTRSKQSLRGILWRCHRDCVRLRQVQLLEGRGEVRAMDGEVIVFRDNVEFIQVLA